MRTAVLLHVGSSIPLSELLAAIENLRVAKVDFDLYVNLVEERVEIVAATAVIKGIFPDATVIVSENRGMDIGGFFYLLPYVIAGYVPAVTVVDVADGEDSDEEEGEQPPSPQIRIQYDYILKLHTKSDPSWRAGLLNPICGTPEKVMNCLSLLLNPQIGMIGSERYICKENKFQEPNCYRLKQLTTVFNIPYVQNHFVGGTMFWTRASVFVEKFATIDIPQLLSKLNTTSTFDPLWYKLNYKIGGNKGAKDSHLHWEVYGKQAGYYCNYLDALSKGGKHTMADGMLEHAYERLFSLIVKQRGLTLLGIL